jgi:hypothetical protein
MRISGTQSSSVPAVRRKQGGASSASGEAFSVDTPAETSAGAPTQRAAPTSPVDALLALQAIEEADPNESRARKRGTKLLDLLEDVRRGLLSGAIPASKLNGLVAAVRSEQAAVSDPKLKAILEQIDLRASVELEKLGIDSGL